MQTSVSRLLTLGLLVATPAVAEEWGSFRGPQHNGLATAPTSVRGWDRAKLKTVWKQDTPAGFSSFAVAGGKAYTIVTGDDDGNPVELGGQYRALRPHLPNLNVLGGCCGTDQRHVEEICKAWLWG